MSVLADCFEANRWEKLQLLLRNTTPLTRTDLWNHDWRLLEPGRDDYFVKGSGRYAIRESGTIGGGWVVFVGDELFMHLQTLREFLMFDYLIRGEV